MPEWDVEQYAAKVVKKLFMPRGDISSFSLFLEREPFPGRNKSSLRRDEKTEQIQNYELFTDSHFPDISSTQIRANMREEYMKHTLHTEDFTFSGLSKRISQYILGNHLYWQLPKKKERILIHVCCGPDVTMPILELKNEYDIICFWYDPNIEPKAEYDKRFLAFKRVCEIENIPFIKGIYDVKNFHKRIA